MGFRMVTTDTASIHGMISEWWEGHGWPSIPVDVLPPVCQVGFDNDRAVCCAFAYEPTPIVAWVDYMVTNPESGMRGAISLKKLMQAFGDDLSNRGFKYIHSCCRQESLGKLLAKVGFDKTDEGVQHFLRVNT